ncbi:MAG TPA: deoxyribodipyrimidine photo-lyase [Acidimicrobiales bacterium]
MKTTTGTVAVVLFTRDLRVHDNPTLNAALRHARTVVPLFVLDPAIVAGPFGRPNRLAFLTDALEDLRASLRSRDGELLIRSGDTVDVVTRVAAETGASSVFVARDVSAFAQHRAARLIRAGRGTARFDVHFCDGLSVVPAGVLKPAGRDHYAVFTPYFRAWSRQARRPVVRAPSRVPMPPGLAVDRVPELAGGMTSPRLPRGGEGTGRRLWRHWRTRHLEEYGDAHDDLARDETSRLSPYFHFGCLSPLEITVDATGRPGGEPFIRQLAWREFFLQVTRAFPSLPRADYRPNAKRWHRDEAAFRSWAESDTGVPIVDAGMRQLRQEGWMHNRARLVCASYLVHDLGVDWRLGARHFLDWLVDGDIANNSGNWQWVAGTGNNPRPNRVMNPWRQAERFDPTGAYVERYAR